MQVHEVRNSLRLMHKLFQPQHAAASNPTFGSFLRQLCTSTSMLRPLMLLISSPRCARVSTHT